MGEDKASNPRTPVIPDAGGILKVSRWCLKLPQVKWLNDGGKYISFLPFCILNPEKTALLCRPLSHQDSSVPWWTGRASFRAPAPPACPVVSAVCQDLLRLPPARRLGRCGPEPASLFCSSLPSSTHSDVMGSLKSVMVGVFIPQKLANATHQGFFYFFIFLSESQFISTPLDSQIQMVYWVTGGKGDGSGGAVDIRREEHKCP